VGFYDNYVGVQGNPSSQWKCVSRTHPGQESAERAARFLVRGSDGLAVAPYGRMRCEAAVLLAQGRPLQALERVECAMHLLARQEKNGTDLLEESLLRDLQNRAQTMLSPL
jgi:hypothetical protein